jgi:hypothetical protein
LTCVLGVSGNALISTIQLLVIMATMNLKTYLLE